MQMRAALSTFRCHHRGLARSAPPASLCVAGHHGRTFCNDAAGGKSDSSPKDGGEKGGMKHKVDQYDIAIVGGGMVGMALACALSSMPLTKHLNVAIIDSNPALGLQNCFKKNETPDPRVSTVTPANISFFREIGAWEYVQQQRHAYFDKMQVWDYTGLGYTRYNAKDIGKEYLGCVVENKVLHYSLLSCLQNADFQKTIYPAKLSSISFQSETPAAKVKKEQAELKAASSSEELYKENLYKENLQQTPRGNSVKLNLSDENSIYAKLVVGADGSKSHVRDMAGIKTTKWNYAQTAIICTVEHTVENQCAWQRFLPSGPIALLPIGNKFSNIVWTMTPEESSDHKLMSEDDFVKAVNHAMDYGYGSHPQTVFLDEYVDKFSKFVGLGAFSVTEGFQVPPKVINVVSERMTFPLSLMHAHDYALRRIALIGDAAHTVHPLAGQGVNLGFGDALALSKVIDEGVSVGADIGEISLLKRYEKERKATNVAMMAIIDGFQKAYSVDLGPINFLRAAALHGAQHIGPLKRNIISFATGDQKWPLFT